MFGIHFPWLFRKKTVIFTILTEKPGWWNTSCAVVCTNIFTWDGYSFHLIIHYNKNAKKVGHAVLHKKGILWNRFLCTCECFHRVRPEISCTCDDRTPCEKRTCVTDLMHESMNVNPVMMVWHKTEDGILQTYKFDLTWRFLWCYFYWSGVFNDATLYSQDICCHKVWMPGSNALYWQLKK